MKYTFVAYQVVYRLIISYFEEKRERKECSREETRILFSLQRTGIDREKEKRFSKLRRVKEREENENFKLSWKPNREKKFASESFEVR